MAPKTKPVNPGPYKGVPKAKPVPWTKKRQAAKAADKSAKASGEAAAKARATNITTGTGTAAPKTTATGGRPPINRGPASLPKVMEVGPTNQGAVVKPLAEGPRGTNSIASKSTRIIDRAANGGKGARIAAALPGLIVAGGQELVSASSDLMEKPSHYQEFAKTGADLGNVAGDLHQFYKNKAAIIADEPRAVPALNKQQKQEMQDMAQDKRLPAMYDPKYDEYLLRTGRDQNLQGEERAAIIGNLTEDEFNSVMADPEMMKSHGEHRDMLKDMPSHGPQGPLATVTPPADPSVNQLGPADSTGGYPAYSPISMTPLPKAKYMTQREGRAATIGNYEERKRKGQFNNIENYMMAERSAADHAGVYNRNVDLGRADHETTNKYLNDNANTNQTAARDIFNNKNNIRQTNINQQAEDRMQAGAGPLNAKRSAEAKKAEIELNQIQQKLALGLDVTAGERDYMAEKMLDQILGNQQLMDDKYPEVKSMQELLGLIKRDIDAVQKNSKAGIPIQQTKAAVDPTSGTFGIGALPGTPPQYGYPGGA